MRCLLLLSFGVGLTASQSFELWNITMPVKNCYFAASIYNNTIQMIDGDSNWLDDPLEYNLLLSPLSSTWTHHAEKNLPLNARRLQYLSQTTVQIDNFIVGINPEVQPYYYNVMVVYDLDNHQYLNISTYQSSMPYSVIDSCVVGNSDFIYIITGYNTDNESESNKMLIYDIDGDEWSTGSDVNYARSYAGCSFDAEQDYIFLFGGTADYDDQNAIEMYDIHNTTKWTILSQKMPYPVDQIRCLLYPKDNNIYCLGGYLRANMESSTLVQVFNPMDYTFNIMYLNYARDEVGVVVYDNVCMIVFGGYSHGDLNTIETLNCNFSA